MKLFVIAQNVLVCTTLTVAVPMTLSLQESMNNNNGVMEQYSTRSHPMKRLYARRSKNKKKKKNSSGNKSKLGNSKVNQDGKKFCSQNFNNLQQGDGTQNTLGQCSMTVQGAIPGTDKMVSTLIIQPENGAKMNGNRDITVELDVKNLETGFFSDPQSEYYMSPQTLNDQGVIQGHQHISVEQLRTKSADSLDASKPTFFKGLEAKSDQKGRLSTVIPAGTITVSGVYRICSITGTLSHQPVIMPIAKRGSQDDCIRVDISI